jgi:hypothetical protein
MSYINPGKRIKAYFWFVSWFIERTNLECGGVSVWLELPVNGKSFLARVYSVSVSLALSPPSIAPMVDILQLCPP